MNLSSVEHFLKIFVITFRWVCWCFAIAPTQKWWQKCSRNLQLIRSSFIWKRNTIFILTKSILWINKFAILLKAFRRGQIVKANAGGVLEENCVSWQMSFGVCLSTIYLLIWRLKTGGPPRDFGVIFEGLFFSKWHFERDIPFLIEDVIRCNKWHTDLPSIFV